MKVAIIHDWLTGMRGGERCLEVFCELFPDAEIYTLLHIKGSVSSTIEKHPIKTSFLQLLPLSFTHYRYYLPIFPFAIESLDPNGFDLILSSSHCVAKGVRVPSGTCHISYVYTPIRYIWDQYDAYFCNGQAGLLSRFMMKFIRRQFQRWDIASSSFRNVHYFIAISNHVAARIQRYYGRQADVIYPPVDLESFSLCKSHEDFYLIVTAFAPYKRIDLAIHAFNEMGKPLKIIGTGQNEKRLKALAGPTIQFLGWQPDHIVREYYGRCKALIFPGEEDFGIVPLEAMACGKPVIAYGKGGALETVVPLNRKSENEKSTMPSGVFFYKQNIEALIEAVQLFECEKGEFDPYSIRQQVERFSRSHFKERIRDLIDKRYREFQVTHSC